MYMLDTIAHIVLPNYEAYTSIFLALVAIPSILGEMSIFNLASHKRGKDIVVSIDRVVCPMIFTVSDKIKIILNKFLSYFL